MRAITLVLRMAVLSGLVLVLASCGGGGSSSGGNTACSLLNAKIYNGQICSQTAQTPVVALAVKMIDNSVQVFCTGTLVTLDDILTSGHCLTQLMEASSEVADFRVIVGGHDGQALSVVNAAIHPFYDGSTGSRYDLAMLTLAQVPTPVIGPLPLLLSEITGPGSVITAFGYGTTQDGTKGELKAATFRVTNITDGNLVVTAENAGSASVCPGDSGGPAVYNSNGTATLAGVNSYIDTRNGACVSTAAQTFGFVDIQNSATLDFIALYAPDAAAW